jgi:hypothetical protein
MSGLNRRYNSLSNFNLFWLVYLLEIFSDKVGFSRFIENILNNLLSSSWLLDDRIIKISGNTNILRASNLAFCEFDF